MTDSPPSAKTPGSPSPGVRAARPEDAAALGAFRASHRQEAPPSNPGAAFDDEAGLWVWIAEDAGTRAVVGAVTLERSSPHAAKMSGLSVAPTARGKGLGRQLVQAALQHCNDNGLIKVMLDAYGDQTVAISLFERFGFQLSRRRQSEGRESMEFYLDLYRRPEGADDPPSKP